MALRYYLAIPAKAWQEMIADYEGEISVRLKKPVFMADQESAALASMYNRAPQLGLSLSLQHKRQPRKLAAELYTESLIVLAIELSEDGAKQGHKLRMLNDTLQLNGCHLGPDVESHASLGLQGPSFCTCAWWPATLEVASREETVLVQPREGPAAWTFYMLVSDSGQNIYAPQEIAKFLAHNTKSADPKAYEEMGILFSSQKAAVLTAALQAKNAKLQIKVMEIKLLPEVLRMTEALKFTQITRFEHTLCDYWMVYGQSSVSSVLPCLLEVAVCATMRSCALEVSAGESQPLTALNSGRDKFELERWKADLQATSARLLDTEEETLQLKRRKQELEDLIGARGKKPRTEDTD